MQPQTVHIRHAIPEDAAALQRLARLDSRVAAPALPALMALVDGVPAAALGLRDGERVADPFRPTADVVRLLELHAEAIAQPAAGSRRVSRVRRLAPTTA